MYVLLFDSALGEVRLGRGDTRGDAAAAAGEITRSLPLAPAAADDEDAGRLRYDARRACRRILSASLWSSVRLGDSAGGTRVGAAAATAAAALGASSVGEKRVWIGDRGVRRGAGMLESTRVVRHALLGAWRDSSAGGSAASRLSRSPEDGPW